MIGVTGEALPAEAERNNGADKKGQVEASHEPAGLPNKSTLFYAFFRFFPLFNAFSAPKTAVSQNLANNCVDDNGRCQGGFGYNGKRRKLRQLTGLAGDGWPMNLPALSQ